MHPLLQEIAVSQRASPLPWSWFSFRDLGRDRGRTQGHLLWTILIIDYLNFLTQGDTSVPELGTLFWVDEAHEFLFFPCKNKDAAIKWWVLPAELPLCLCSAPGRVAVCELCS